MTKHHKHSESLKSVAGAVLVGFGLHVLPGNLDHAAAQLKHILGAPTGETFEALPTIVIATSQVARAYALDHQGFLLSLFHMLLLFWPLLLLIVGTILLRDVFTDGIKTLPTPNED